MKLSYYVPGATNYEVNFGGTLYYILLKIAHILLLTLYLIYWTRYRLHCKGEDDYVDSTNAKGEVIILPEVHENVSATSKRNSVTVKRDKVFGANGC